MKPSNINTIDKAAVESVVEKFEIDVGVVVGERGAPYPRTPRGRDFWFDDETGLRPELESLLGEPVSIRLLEDEILCFEKLAQAAEQREQ